eukprot:TRINITY_DN5772_c0_g1_i3.p1 TRINITY_DN5772_c0_g1~~TRINITY_DN5772_c0_g1_i3.p1  ORF type:complete len:215 (+),score=46.27 TRINITY_DN5772_c0_g1_i3:81-725(+)
MESTSQRAARELLMDRDWFIAKGQAVYTPPAPSTALCRGVKFTLLGGYRLEQLPPSRTITEANLKEAETIMGKSSSLPNLEGGPSWPCAAPLGRPRSSYKHIVKKLDYDSRMHPASRDWGLGAHAAVQQGGDPYPGKLQRSPSSSRKSKKEAKRRSERDGATSNEGRLTHEDRYENRCVTRFLKRKPNGGFFEGSGISAPKLTVLNDPGRGAGW